ncbi:unnamed protein product [Caenorhabditis auriculariae]|uniref:EGF-like domain-containing protein n=1 Tax=Caenorhabditis auriculariae TaxID=2777116 RepID=A0A8S1HU11_9PELO|nr:unnamed protein product [Caenorhabditis auriculariae]
MLLFRPWSLLLLLLTVVFASCDERFELRGHWNAISAQDVRDLSSQKFDQVSNEAHQRFSILFGTNFRDFVITELKIHGENVGEATSVFVGYLTTSSGATRKSVIEVFASCDDIEVYFVRHAKDDENLERWTAPFRDDVTSCVNGGIFLPNGTCACFPYTSGTQCQTVTCRNGGIQEEWRCSCPPGVYTLHCEPRTCATPVQNTLDLSKQSLILVVNLVNSMALDLNVLITNLPELLKDYNNLKEGVIQNYIVTSYRQSNSAYFIETSVFLTSDDLLNYMQQLVVAPGLTDQPHLDALYAAQSSSILMRPQSTVLLFADSEVVAPPTPSTRIGQNNESQVVQQTLAWKNKIVIIISQMPSAPLEPLGDFFDVLRRVVAATHGDLLIVDKTDLDSVTKNLLSYFYEMQNVFVQYYNNSTKTIPISSDSKTANSYVLLTCENGRQLPTLTNAADGSPIKSLTSGPRYALYVTQNSVSATVSVTGTDTHNVRVWFASLDDVLVTYSNRPEVDVGTAYSFTGMDQIASLYSSISGTTGLKVTRIGTYDGATVVAEAVAATDPNNQICNFPYKLPAIKTCTPGPFIHSVAITTATGVLNRVLPGYCASPDTHTAAALVCSNGGTASDGVCKCGANFQGKNCELPICQNGGTVDKFPNGNGHGFCLCNMGFSGSFCEILSCNSTSSDTFESFQRSFAVVVENSLAASAGLSNLYDSLKIFLQPTSGGVPDFDDFVLTTFKARTINGTSSPLVVSNKYNNASNFLAATLPVNIGYSFSPLDMSPPGLLALQTTMRSIDHDKSSIFFFTTAQTDVAADYADYNDLLRSAVERQIEVSIVLIPPFNISDYCTGNYTLYEEFARQSGGNFINLCLKYVSDRDPILNFIASYGNSHHHTEVIEYKYVADCSQETKLRFFVSDPSTAVYAVVNSPTVQNFTATLTNGDSNVIQTLTPDAHAVPFFASYQIKPTAASVLGYTLTIKAADGTSGKCWVRVDEKSQLSVYVGFSPDPTKDKVVSSLIFASKASPVLHISSALQSDPTTQLSTTDDTGATVYQASGTRRLASCKYEYYFDSPFVCAAAGESFTITATIKTAEVTVQRTQRAFCYISEHQCLNGGLYINGCQCINGYTGNYCEIPPCQNGGTPSNFQCLCQSNFTGSLCQLTSCYDWNFVETHDLTQLDFQQITFVLEVNSRAMLLPIIYLQTVIPTFVSNTYNSLAPKQYTLVTFDETGASVIASTAHPDVFNNAIANLPKGLNTPTATASYDGVLKAFAGTLERPAIIFVFSATSPKTSSVVDLLRQRYGTQVNVIYPNSTAPLPPTGSTNYLIAASRQSNGRVIPIQSSLFTSLPAILAQMLKENALLLDFGAKDCSTAQTFSFFVESNTTKLVVLAKGNNVQATFTNPAGQQTTINRGNLVLNDVNTKMYSIDVSTQRVGKWTVTLKTSASSCNIQARSISTLHVVPGFTSDPHMDYVHREPTVGTNGALKSYITFRITESYDFDSINYGASVKYLEAYNTDLQEPWSTNTLSVNVTVNQRDPLACASQFVTPIIAWSSSFEKFIVYGLDGNGNMFQRTFFFNKQSGAKCVHGSFDAFGQCICQTGYSGPSCNQPVCQNGATPAYGVCDCPNGYYGVFCEQYITSATLFL